MKAAFETTVGDIAHAVGGKIIVGEPSRAIHSITSDSRDIDVKALFVPIVGETFDGHAFIADLARGQKIECFLTSRAADESIAKETGVAAILCENTLYALGNIGRVHREKFSIPVVGVTGTNGKTTTKELLACALSSLGSVMKSEKNYNNEIGVPFTLMGLSAEHTHAVIEMGMNHTGEISRLTAMVQPTLAVITNAGEGHLEFLGSVENVAHAKSEIMESMKPGSVIILNEESECFDVMRTHAEKRRLDIKTVGIDQGQYRPQRYTLSPSGVELEYKGLNFSVPLYGIHNIHNIMAAIVAAEILGADLSRVTESFRSFQNVGKRSDLTEGRFVLVNDTYNSNPLSLRYALRSLAEVYRTRRKIAVLSDMKELGEHSERCHRTAGEEVKNFGYDALYTFGDMSQWINQGARDAGMPAGSANHYASKGDLIDALRNAVADGDAIIVKGSRSMKMEEVADALLGII